MVETLNTMPETKYPKEYLKEEIGDLKNAFKPEFKYDSRGRLIMPLPGYSKFMLSVEPGSKKIGQGSEDEAGGPGTTPESLKSGYIFAETAIKVGPEGGWVAQIAGGDHQYPISYFNETTEEVKFYLDKEGNVYLKGKIEAEEGGLIAGWTIGAEELYIGLQINSTLYRTGLNPLAWPFYVKAPKVNGDYDPAQAVFRVNNLGQVWCSQLTILGGTGVANLDDAGALALLDKANIDDDVDDGSVYARIKKIALDGSGLVLIDEVIDGDTYQRVKKTALNASGLVLLDQIIEGTYKRVKAVAIDVDGMVLLDQTIEGTYGLVLTTQIAAGKIELTSSNFKLDENGVITGTPGSTRVELTSGGLKAYSGATLKVEIKSADGSIVAKKGTVGGWVLGDTIFKSSNNNIELDPSAPHIKVKYGTTYIQMTPASNLPRIDVYKSGVLRARFWEEGLYLYNSSGNLTGKIIGSTSGGYGRIDFSTVTYLDLSSLSHLDARGAIGWFDSIVIGSTPLTIACAKGPLGDLELSVNKNIAMCGYLYLGTLASDPTGVLGCIFYHTGTKKLRIYGGDPAGWKDIAYA